MKRRIAVALEYPLLQLGGVEALVQKLLKGLSECYEITLVSGDENGKEAIKSYADFIAGHIYWDKESVTHSSSKELAGKLKAAGVELAHFHFGGVYCWGARILGRCPVVACSLAGIPCVTTVHLVEPDFEGFCGPKKPFWFKAALWPGAWISRLHVLLTSQGEIAVSNHDMAQMQKWFNPWKKRISRLYHSRIEADKEREIELSHRDPVILSVGTIGPRKGQPYLIRAFAEIALLHPQWRLVIAGRASEDAVAEELRNEIAQSNLGERIVWTGALKDKEIVDLMYSASLFAMPSLQEGLGLSLQEALYRGCPAVGSKVGGIPELIDHERNGLLVSPGSVDELADALNRILSDNALRHQLAADARPSILRKEMTQEQMVANYRAVYDSILS